MYKGCVGQEIFYCSLCQSQLRSSDFEKNKGYKLDLDAVCLACAPVALKSFPPHKREQLERAMTGAGTKSSSSMPASTPRSGTGRVPLATSTPKSGTGRIPMANPPPSTRRSTAAEDKTLKPLMLGLCIAGLLIVAGVFSMSRRRPVEDHHVLLRPVHRHEPLLIVHHPDDLHPGCEVLLHLAQEGLILVVG